MRWDMQRHIQKVFLSKTYPLHWIQWLLQQIDTSHLSLLHFVFSHETVTWEKIARNITRKKKRPRSIKAIENKECTNIKRTLYRKPSRFCLSQALQERSHSNQCLPTVAELLSSMQNCILPTHKHNLFRSFAGSQHSYAPSCHVSFPTSSPFILKPPPSCSKKNQHVRQSHT